MTKTKKYYPNKAYPISGVWQGVYNKAKKAKGKPVPVALRLMPGLLEHVAWSADGIRIAYENGYLEMKAKCMDDGNIYLSSLIEQNMGDCDGFGIEPDDYLVGVVAPDGTFIEPLHII